MTEPVDLDIQAILERLPHRYPFLLVDRVLECRPGESIRALKNVTYNEPYFQGHFPSRPVMPGVIIIEALAQAAGILCFVTAGVIPDAETRFYFVGIDKARFRRPASAPTTASSSSPRSGTRRRTRSTRASRPGSRSAIATCFARAAPSTAARPSTRA